MNDKLLAIQQALKAPKDKKNTFANFQYRSAEDILEAVKPIAHKQECVVTLSDTAELIGTWNYIKATATLSGKAGTIQTTAYARETEIKKGMDSAQITGSASSYARKYALSGLFAIDDSRDDPDGKDNSAAKQVDTPQPEPTPEPKVDTLAVAKNNLNELLEKHGYDNTVKKKLRISKILDKSTVDTEAEANQVIEAIENENQS